MLTASPKLVWKIQYHLNIKINKKWKLNNYLVKFNSQILLKFQITHLCKWLVAGISNFHADIHALQPADDNTRKYLSQQRFHHSCCRKSFRILWKLTDRNLDVVEQRRAIVTNYDYILRNLWNNKIKPELDLQHGQDIYKRMRLLLFPSLDLSASWRHVSVPCLFTITCRL